VTYLTNSGSRPVHRLLTAAATIAGLAGTASAQWTTINLHPPGEGASMALGVSNGQQVGFASSNFDNAYLWTGTAMSAVNLNSSVATTATCVSAGVQGGIIDLGVAYHACLWTGTPGSLVDLHPVPTGTTYSRVCAMTGGSSHQAGFVFYPSGPRACRWTGTAASWVDLNPVGAAQSEALGVHGGQQAGRVMLTAIGAFHASLWTGTAASWVDLHPPGSNLGSSSAVYGVHSLQQAGYAHQPGVSGYRSVASLWTGTAASWVNLHPPTIGGESIAFAVHNGQQVGTIFPGGGSGEHACIWSGSAASFVDLHDFLPIPTGFGRSEAFGIWHDATHTYVVGYAIDATGAKYAVMWVRSQTTTCYANCDGVGGLTGNDFQCFLDAYVAGASYANCDGVGGLTGNDFQCFLNAYVAGCS